MLLKLELIYIISCLTGIYMQYLNPSCGQIDFNYIESVLEFQSCEDGEMFTIKSYADGPFESYRNVENHLSNVGVGLSCFRTVQIFNLDNYTEIDSLIYLNSLNVEDESFVHIQAFDTVTGIVYFMGSVTASNEWNGFHADFTLAIQNAQIEIRANTTADALLAIEYLSIVNPTKAEPYCRRTLTTSTEGTTNPTDPTESVTTELSEPVTTELTEPVTTELTEPVTTELTEAVTTELTEPVTSEPTEPETTTVLIPTQTPTDSPTEPPSTTEGPGIVCTPDDDLLPNPLDCNSFYQCVNGVPVLLRCASDHEGKPLLVFNPNLQQCVYPDEYDCNTLSEPPWE